MYFEIAALLAAIIFWPGLRESRLRWFLPFLFFIVAAEFAGRYMARELKQPNAWLYNFVVPVEYLFYTFIYLLHYKRKTNRFVAKLFFSVFILYAVISLYIKGVTYFNTDFLLYGSFFMILLSVLFFLECYQQLHDTPIWRLPVFWVATGVLLFNAGEFFYNLLSKFFIHDYLDPNLELFRSINNKLILVLYSCFILAFYARRLQRHTKRNL
jgi:hypothetical protein